MEIACEGLKSRGLPTSPVTLSSTGVLKKVSLSDDIMMVAQSRPTSRRAGRALSAHCSVRSMRSVSMTDSGRLTTFSDAISCRSACQDAGWGASVRNL